MSRNDSRACPQGNRQSATSSRQQNTMAKSNKAATDERYLALRRRNNAAVRKSRQKLREKQNEVFTKLSMLQQEHTNLQNMVSSRLREVKLLYSLLQQVGHTPPNHMDELLAAGASSSCSSAFSILPSSTETLPPFDALSSPQNPFEGSSPSSSGASTTSITAASVSMLGLLVAEESPGPCGTLPPPN